MISVILNICNIQVFDNVLILGILPKEDRLNLLGPSKSDLTAKFIEILKQKEVSILLVKGGINDIRFIEWLANDGILWFQYIDEDLWKLCRAMGVPTIYQETTYQDFCDLTIPQQQTKLLYFPYPKFTPSKLSPPPPSQK